MLADQLLKEGDPRGALAHLQEIVKKDPSSSAWRTYLFQLLSVVGEWSRAATQLDVLVEMDPKTSSMATTYREALRCEVIRGEVFAGRRSPVFFGEPDPWMGWMAKAQELLAQGKVDEAETLREQAFGEAPETPGEIDGRRFEWIADGDSRLGPILEAIVLGRYYWVPFVRIRELILEKPEDLRDLVWAPAQFVWTNGGTAVGFVPTRYPGSEASADGMHVLARKTEWTEAGPATFVGRGQRTLATDGGEYALLDVRRILIDSAGG